MLARKGGGAAILSPLSRLQNCVKKHQSMITAEIPSIWRTRSFLPTLAPISCVQAALGTWAQLPAIWLLVLSA